MARTNVSLESLLQSIRKTANDIALTDMERLDPDTHEVVRGLVEDADNNLDDALDIAEKGG